MKPYGEPIIIFEGQKSKILQNETVDYMYLKVVNIETSDEWIYIYDTKCNILNIKMKDKLDQFQKVFDKAREIEELEESEKIN